MDFNISELGDGDCAMDPLEDFEFMNDLDIDYDLIHEYREPNMDKTSCLLPTEIFDEMDADAPENEKDEENLPEPPKPKKFYPNPYLVRYFDVVEPEDGDSPTRAKCKKCETVIKFRTGYWIRHLDIWCKPDDDDWTTYRQSLTTFRCIRCQRTFKRKKNLEKHSCCGPVVNHEPWSYSMGKYLETYQASLVKSGTGWEMKKSIYWPSSLECLLARDKIHRYTDSKFKRRLESCNMPVQKMTEHRVTELMNRYFYFIVSPKADGKNYAKPYVPPEKDSLSELMQVNCETTVCFKPATRVRWDFMTKGAFYSMLKEYSFKRTIITRSPMGEPIERETTVNLAVWWESQTEKNKIQRFIFDPRLPPGLTPEMVTEKSLDPEGNLIKTKTPSTTKFLFWNEWRGLPYCPFRSGQKDPLTLKEWEDVMSRSEKFGLEWQSQSVHMYVDHIYKVICNGDRESFDYIMGLLSRKMLDPAWCPGTSILISGYAGVGKTLFARIYCNLFGVHGVYLERNQQLTSQFGSALFDQSVVLCADEVSADGLPSNIIKTAITADEVNIERKGKDAYQIDNHRLILMTTEDTLLDFSLSQRRLAFFRCAAHLLGDEEREDHYYRPMLERFNTKTFSGRLALCALTLFFIEHNIVQPLSNRFKAEHYPRTKAMLAAQQASMHPIDQWWYFWVCDEFNYEINPPPLPLHYPADPENLSRPIAHREPWLRAATWEILHRMYKSWWSIHFTEHRKHSNLYQFVMHVRQSFPERYRGTLPSPIKSRLLFKMPTPHECVFFFHRRFNWPISEKLQEIISNQTDVPPSPLSTTSDI